MGEYADQYMRQQMREAAAAAVRKIEREMDAPARVVLSVQVLQEFAKESGLQLSAPSPHHLQVRQDGAVFAEWWPSKGTTRMDGKNGPRCCTVGEFIEWLKSA